MREFLNGVKCGNLYFLILIYLFSTNSDYEEDNFEGLTEEEYEVMLKEYFGVEKYERYNMRNKISCIQQ